MTIAEKIAWMVWVPLLWSCFAGAQVYHFSKECVQAYDAAMQLKPRQAAVWLEKEKKQNPGNVVPLFLENYLDFFELFLNEDPAAYTRLKDQKKKRLQAIANAPGDSPLKGFMQAVIYLQWAAVDGKFGNKMSAGWGFRDALKTIKENEKRYPDFSPNKMILGPVQMAAGTIPKGYKWLSGLIGISGDLTTGKKQMDQFLAATDPWANLFKNEGIFYHCYLQFYLLNEQEEALELIRSRKLDLVNNHLFTFMAANLHLNNKQSHLTKSIVLARNKSPEYMQTTVWDFELAYASLYQLAPDAHVYFNRFLQQFKGSYYVKDAWHKLAMHYLLQGNMQEYNRCLQKVRTVGKQEAEADKRAYREAVSGKTPNTTLLKARLLSDGGYHKEALAVLAGKSTQDFANSADKLEFTYRLARILDDMGQHAKAIESYEAAIALGSSSSEYYAARAALQIGLIYEEQGKCREAIAQFQRCIDMKDHDYEQSLEQKAKAGINRCKQK